MNPETGTFISMDSYAGSLDNPVSLHKYLYANANPVMYTDPTGYFSLSESSVAQACRNMLDTANITPLKILHKTMQWANIVVTVYDAWDTYSKLQSGESTVMDVAIVIMGGILINGLLQCWVGSETAAIILKVVNAKMSSNSLKEAIKSRDPEKIMIEVLRFMVALYSFHCECFTGETLVSTTEGDKRIDEIEVGDYVYAYDTETEETVPARVTYVSVTETNILVHVYTSEGEEIKTTMLHPFYVKNVKNGEDEEYGIWKASANLVAGDELLTEDGRVVYVEEVRIERLAESIKVYNLEVEGLHTYYVGSGVLVHNDYAIENGNNTGDKKTPVDLYSFGNKSTPRGARPQQDFGVENFDSVIEAQIGPFPNGASNVIDVNTTPLKGFFHKLPAGTTLPEGLDVIADGIDVFPDSPHGAGHYTIFPTRNMTVDEFNELFKSLDWELGGKK